MTIRSAPPSVRGDAAALGLDLDVVEDDRRENHPGDAHQLLAEDEADEREPHRILDAVAHDLAVEEIFRLVQHHQKHKCEQGQLRRNGERHADNEGVADDVADDGQQPAQEGDADQHPGVGQMVPEQKPAVSPVLMAEMAICAPMTVAKLR